MYVSGLVSGIDYDSIISQLMAVERRPILLMERDKNALAMKRDFWSDMNSRLLDLREALGDLTLSSTYESKDATSSDDSVLTASTSAEAVAATYDVVVNNLATAHKLASDRFDDPTAALGLTGDVTINGVTVSISEADSLNDIRDAINNVDAGVTASVVDNTLVLTAEDTGAANAIQLVDDNNVLAILGFINNYALADEGATVAASSEYDSRFLAQNAIDGYTDSDLWAQVGGGWNDATEGSFSDTLTVSFGQVRTIDRVLINTLDSATYPADQWGIRDFELQYRASDSDPWTTLTTVSGNTAGEITLDFQAVSAAEIRLVITTTNSPPGSDYSRVVEIGAFDTQNPFKHELQAAQDASLTIDGLSVTRPENTITDVIAGVTLNLKGEGSATLTVSQDVDSAISAIKAFVEEYNEIYKHMNTSLMQGGQMQGDSTLMRVQGRIRDYVSRRVTDDDSWQYRSLADIGITTQGGMLEDKEEYGLLTVDEAKLREALETDPAAVKALFAAESADEGFDGVATRLYDYLYYLTRTGGIVPTHEASYDDQIAALDDRIAAAEERLEMYEQRLVRQFVELEKALSLMQSQSAWLQNQLVGMTFMMG